MLTGRDQERWISDFYSSIGKFKQPFLKQGFCPTIFYETYIQNSYLQAAELRRSLSRAYSLYGLELMYNSGVGYVDRNGSYILSNFVNRKAIEYVANIVLVPGVVPPIVVVVFLTLWAVGSLILSLA